MAFRLTSTLGTWDLAAGETLIGRSRSCAICFLDGRLSRRHASIQIQEQQALVRDFGSVNGVMLNGQRIHGATPLKHGDQLIVGPFLFQVASDTKPSPPTTSIVAKPGVDQPSTAVVATDAIERRVEHGSPPRRLAPVIAAAITPASEQQGSEVFRPSDYQANDTDAVLLREPTPNPDATIDDLLVEAHERATTISEEPAPAELLALPRSRAVTRRQRACAGIADTLFSSCVATLVSVPLFALGYVLALHRAGATIVDGVPQLQMGQISADPAHLALTMLSATGLDHAVQMLPQLNRLADRAPFHIVILSAILAFVVFILVHLGTTIVATILRGAPFWHLRFGLRLVDQRNGLAPGLGQTFLRWSLLLLLWPAAIVTWYLGRMGLHDRWSHCELRTSLD